VTVYWQTHIKYSSRERPLIISKEFKAYRTLMLQLASEGVGYESGEVVDGAKPVLVHLLYPFPRTLKKSSMGIPLTEEELRERFL
jgi:hypothetical protein